LVERCETLPPGSDVASDAYQYAYVRLCGLFEQSLLWLGRSVMHRLAGGEAREFGLSFHDRSGRNPTKEYTRKFVARFNLEWAAELDGWFSIDDRGQVLSALVGIRVGLAHGLNYGASASRFTGYYTVVYDLLDWLLERFEPVP